MDDIKKLIQILQNGIKKSDDEVNHVTNELEKKKLAFHQRMTNALGFDIDLTRLTEVVKRVTTQKFFEIAPADFIPIRVGQGSWNEQLITYRTFDIADDFEKGMVDVGLNNARMMEVDTGIDSVPVQVHGWVAYKQWSYMELMKAQQANSWDIVAVKEKARKKNWDLGVQRIAFLGSRSVPSTRGLLNQDLVNINTTVIPKDIKAMDPTELKQFLADMVTAYRENCEATAWPNVFLVPESDYLGLGSPPSAVYPTRTTLNLMQESFIELTGKLDFKIVGCKYGDPTFSEGVLTNKRYALYNKDEESLRMDIPVDYTSTPANTLDGFSFQNVAFGQFTGVKAYREREMLYFEN